MATRIRKLRDRSLNITDKISKQVPLAKGLDSMQKMASFECPSKLLVKGN